LHAIAQGSEDSTTSRIGDQSAPATGFGGHAFWAAERVMRRRSVSPRARKEKRMEGGVIWLSIMGGIVVLSLIFVILAVAQRRRSRP
jgi:hypothetical protein